MKQRRERDTRARRAAQSVKQRQARLHKSATEHKRQAAETPDHREARLEEWRAAQHELEIGSCDCWRKRGQTGGTESSSAGEIGSWDCWREARLEGQRADQQEPDISMLHKCLYLDLTHSVYFLCGILCLRFSYILATAPRSACTLAQARPTMSCIRLVLDTDGHWINFYNSCSGMYSTFYRSIVNWWMKAMQFWIFNGFDDDVFMYWLY